MIEINNQTRSRINLTLVKKIAETFLAKKRLTDRSLSIAFVGDTVMSRLNRTYRGKIGPTDILSFEGDAGSLGGLVIDYSQIKRQAKSFSDSTDQELAFILVHGLFHLIGYDDHTEKDRLKMIKLGETFLKEAKFFK